MTFKFLFAAFSVAFLALGASGAIAHPSESHGASPTDHQHFHCHQNQTCHSHGHGAAHH